MLARLGLVQQSPDASTSRESVSSIDDEEVIDLMSLASSLNASRPPKK